MDPGRVGREAALVLDGFEALFRQAPPALFVLCLLLFATVGLLGGLKLARRTVVRRTAESRRLGEWGRQRALALLRRKGFEILDTEVTAPGLVQVDGRLHEYVVRADALVRRKRRTYVAEFKGGAEAARVLNRATRRQLLEYSCVYGVEGVLLVDGGAGQVHYVRFVSASTREARAFQRV